MAEDVREAILSRLVILMNELSGVDEVARNELVSDDTRETVKRIVILEGDEITPEQVAVNRPANTPLTIYMHPQIVLCNFAKPSDFGAGLSAMRGQVIKAIATDAALIALTSNGHGGRYVGMESDLVFARAMDGHAALKFQFTYLLRPDQF